MLNNGKRFKQLKKAIGKEMTSSMVINIHAHGDSNSSSDFMSAAQYLKKKYKKMVMKDGHLK